jgi:hypothetical protein
MASEKQIEANRLNALKSTGPTTEAGRRASSRNSLKFGIHIHARRLVRLGTGILNDSRERVLLEHLYTGADGKPTRRFDLSLYDPEERRNIANMHLGLAWLRVQAPMEAISRQEARLAARLRRAEARFDVLFKAPGNGAATAREPVPDDLAEAPTPSGAGSQPAAPSQGAFAPETTPAPAPETQSAQPVLQNEPNSDPEPAPEPPALEPPAQLRKPVLQNEPNYPQVPVFPINDPLAKPAAPDAPLPNSSDKDIA